MNWHELGDLADPTQCHGPINIHDETPSLLVEHLRQIVLIRMAEQHLAQMRKEGHIGGPVHLGVGQEAVAVGVTAGLSTQDMVFGAHRSHSHVLAMGSSVHGLFAEVLGKATGLSKGMGGSMHLWDGPKGFFGSVPIVAGTVPIAVGAGLAAKFKGTGGISVSYLGDGAVEEGAVQESLNLARILNAPVLFVVENNFFASHMEIGLRQPFNATTRFASVNGIPHMTVDGNDVVAVRKASAELIKGARAGEGPAFLEAVTFRWYGHVDWREDIDVGVNRSVEHLANWRARDPLGRLQTAMEAAGMWSPAQHETLVAEIRESITSAWSAAMSDPWPAEHTLLGAVYSDRSRPS